MRSGNPVIESLRALGLRIEPGAEQRLRFSDGDLEVEISVLIRPKVTRSEVVSLRDEALAWLEARSPQGWTQAFRARRCACWLTTRSKFSGRERQCSGAVAYVVVSSAAALPFHFVCARHKERHGVDPKYVKAVIELPPALLSPILRRAKAKQRERDKKYMRDDHARGDHLRQGGVDQCEECQQASAAAKRAFDAEVGRGC